MKVFLRGIKKSLLISVFEKRGFSTSKKGEEIIKRVKLFQTQAKGNQLKEVQVEWESGGREMEVEWESRGREVEVEWESGEKRRFKSIWLRDHCGCESCVDSWSKQKLVLSPHIPLHLSFLRLQLLPHNNSNSLKVLFDDNHSSFFSSQWLLSKKFLSPPNFTNSNPCNLIEQRREGELKMSVGNTFEGDKLGELEKKKWDICLLKKEGVEEPIEFEDFMEGGESMVKVFERVFKFGICFLKNVPQDKEEEKKEGNGREEEGQREGGGEKEKSYLLRESVGKYFKNSIQQPKQPKHTPQEERGKEQDNKSEGGELYGIDFVGDQLGMSRRETLYGRSWQVKTVEKASNLAYSSKPLEWHQDLLYMQNPPSLQLLHCNYNETEGGDTLFVDGFLLSSLLKKESPLSFHTLSSIPVGYHYYLPNAYLYFHKKTILETSGDFNTLFSLNYSPHWMSQLEINNTQVQPFYSSLQNFSNLMQREENICSKHFSPGDLVIFDNRRILHARTPFTKMGKRVLRGCYIDYDDFHARFREILSNI